MLELFMCPALSEVVETIGIGYMGNMVLSLLIESIDVLLITSDTFNCCCWCWCAICAVDSESFRLGILQLLRTAAQWSAWRVTLLLFMLLSMLLLPDGYL